MGYGWFSFRIPYDEKNFLLRLTLSGAGFYDQREERGWAVLFLFSPPMPLL